MSNPHRSGSPLGGIAFFAISLSLAAYFTFAAVQGDFGVIRRAEITAHGDALATEAAQLEAEVARMENLTDRLSDDYLDLDLLDERARDILGMSRPDELVVR